MNKDKLGKGIDNFFNNIEEKSNNENSNFREINIDLIIANTDQPRSFFDEEKLLELSESIKENGILQPLTVVKTESNKFELIAGERRLRASKLAGLETVPVIIVEKDTKEKSTLAIIENLQREDLGCIELARAYKKHMDQFKENQETLAKKLGVPRASIANSLRLLKLPEEVIKYLEKGKLSQGHGKILAGIKDEEFCINLAKKAVYGDLSVKKLGELLKKQDSSEITSSESNVADSMTNYENHKNKLNAETGLTFEIKSLKNNAGKITLNFSSEEELNEILEKLIKK